MYKINEHPILDIPKTEEVVFTFNGQKVTGHKGYTIAAALHQAGFPIHSHSIDGRERSLECGIGKCGACQMLVDGVIKRICITPVDGVTEVKEIPQNYFPESAEPKQQTQKIYKTQVVIIGAGPAGLACREMLNEQGISNIVIDNNERVGGQFNMQTHQFFFFEKEKLYGGMRGFDIAKTLAGDDHSGIFLSSTVWDLLEGPRVAVKNLKDGSIYYVDAEYLVVATGAVPFMPVFENDDLPGVYTAAVVQKMMNVEHTLLGKRILSIGAGNIGYLTSYQATQAGAKVVAIVEAMDHEGGFPVQANRVRRLGIPIYTSHVLLRAIPNEDHTGIVGAVIAECKNFKPVPGTEKTIEGIDVINICTGLIPDNQLLQKGRQVFGLNTFGAGDAVRVGEGTCAVLRGKQVALEIAMQMGKRVNYDDYLAISKQYIDSQQHPVRVLETPNKPTTERMNEKGFVVADCLYGFACNPCSFSCPQGAITKSSTSSVPVIDYNKCIGCMECVSHCPGLAIFGYNLQKEWLFLPIEYPVDKGAEVVLINDKGEKVGKGIVENIKVNPNKTNVARVKALDVKGEKMTEVTGFIVKEKFGEQVQMSAAKDEKAPAYVCHCEDVQLDKLLKVIGDRKIISVDELKHTTRIGMGTCRGKRCIPRVKQLLRSYGIKVVGDATPRGPLSNQLTINEMQPNDLPKEFITDVKKATRKVECDVFVAGGGIAGSGLLLRRKRQEDRALQCGTRLLMALHRWRPSGLLRPGNRRHRQPQPRNFQRVAEQDRRGLLPHPLCRFRPRRSHLQILGGLSRLVGRLHGGPQGFPERDFALLQPETRHLQRRLRHQQLLAGHARQGHRLHPSPRLREGRRAARRLPLGGSAAHVQGLYGTGLHARQRVCRVPLRALCQRLRLSGRQVR